MPRNRLQNRNPVDRSTQKTLPKRFCPALALLLDAFEYAEQTNGEHWEFATEIQQLHEAGLTKNDLRFLVRKQLVVHASEMTITGHDGRQFQSTGDLTFTKRTCIVLTPNGVVAARESRKARSDNNVPRPSANRTVVESGTAAAEPPVLTWDPERRTLSIDGTTVKHFKWTAINQEVILAAFEEEGWPTRIDDPLPPHPEQDSKRRLSDTIKCLNRKQANPLIHFRGDGTGEGIVWEFVERNAEANGAD